MLAFTAFFVVPVIWVLIAPTKTDHQLVYENPMAFGSFHTFLQTWDEMYAFQAHELMTWLGNSARYSVGGVFLALACAVPAGYGLALTQFIGRRVLLSITLLVMIMPASALVLPLFLEMNLLHLSELGLVGGPPLWLLPVRGLPCLHFLLVDDPQGAPGRGQGRWLQRVGGLPLGGAASGPAHSGPRRVLRLRVGLDQFLPALRDVLYRQAVPAPRRPAVPHILYVGFQPRCCRRP